MELVVPRPAVSATFEVSLPYDLLTTLMLLDLPYIGAGASEWLTRARTALPAELAERVHALVGVLNYTARLWGRLTGVAPDHPARRAFEPFASHLRGVPASDYRDLALASLGDRLARWELEPDPARRTPAALGRSTRRLVAYLDALEAARRVRRPGSLEAAPDNPRLAALLLDGERLKAEIVAVVDELWRDVYRERFAADLPRLDAAVAYHRRQAYPPDFPSLLLAVTGRAVPEVLSRYLDGIGRVEFVPHAHIGPFLVFTPVPPALTIAFSALGRAPYPEAPFERYPLAHNLLPVLDALADDTRLSILELLHRREMYAQEIAAALGLSPSVISRHLGRLEQAGVVRARRAGTAKHYSLDTEHGQALVASLTELIGVA